MHVTHHGTVQLYLYWGVSGFYFLCWQILRLKFHCPLGKFLGIGYLRNRLTGTCENPYDWTEIYKTYRLVQVLDPSFAVQNLDLSWIDALVVIKPLEALIPKLKQEMPLYLAKCSGTTFDHQDVNEFTKGILLFWKTYGEVCPTWALAMRTVGSFTPNSAAAERVFSLLKVMFGDLQDRAFSNYLHRPH
jgi:hypothetical protein